MFHHLTRQPNGNKYGTRRSPVVVSRSRYERLLVNANPNAVKLEEQKQIEKERSYQAKLKSDGEALLLSFKGPLRCTNEWRVAELRLKEAKKVQQINETNDTIAKEEAEERDRVRKERIAKAQLLMQKLMPGPRELKSAQLQCEVLHSMNLQRDLQLKFAEAAREQRIADNKTHNEQIQNGIKTAQQEQHQRAKNAQKYKCEIQQTIEERNRMRAKERENEIRSIKNERETFMKDTEALIAKDRAANERKRKELRKNALEAIKMAEERRKRQTILDEVDSSKSQHYNAAKANLEQLKIVQSKQRLAKRIQQNEKLAKEIAPRLHYSASKDNMRHEQQLNSMRKAFSAEEKSKNARNAAAKQARIEAQLQEQAASKAAKDRAAVEKREAIALRLQNQDIFRRHKMAEHRDYLNSVHELRKRLDEQVKYKTDEDAKPQTNYNRDAHLETLNEHKFFFDYAKQLMTNAKERGCPLKPFIRTVTEYKREHNIPKDPIKIPKHLVSKLTMGLRTPGDSLVKTKKETEKSEEETLHNAILSNYEEVQNLITKSTTESKDK